MRLIYYGNPILRKKANEVEAITPEIKAMVAGMIDVLEKTKSGVGLAAPQVGLSLRIFILRDEIQKEDGSWEFGPIEVYINPKLTEPSDEKIAMDEGCLSIPGLTATIVRPERITVEALDLEGKPFKKTCSALIARIIMHENDHLNGVLFIDRLSKKERNSLEEQLRAIKLRYK